jgi:two-component system, NtrC family, sensor histidine kinase PilS
MSHGALTVDHSVLDEADRLDTIAIEPARDERPATPTEGLHRRLVAVVALRPLLASLIIGAGLFVDASDPNGLPRDYACYLLAAVYGLSVVYFVVRRGVERWPWLVEAQLVIDVWTISSVVVLTGGFHSDFVALYVLPILAGSVLRLKRGGLVVAGYSSMLFGMIVASQYGIVIPCPELWA